MYCHTYLIKYKNELYGYPCNVNKRGFTYDEAIQFIDKKKWEDALLISIKNEIEKYKLQGDISHKTIMLPEVYDYEIWYNAYLNNNINGFSLPMYVNTNDEYIARLEDTLRNYIDEIKRPAFIYEKDLIDDIERNCKIIMQTLKLLINKELPLAEKNLMNMVMNYSNDSFMVSELDKSYSFRGIAPFMNLQSDGYNDTYEKMCNQELTFFRVRTKKKGSI